MKKLSKYSPLPLNYWLFYAMGWLIAHHSIKLTLIESLTILGPITLTALFASLLVPFAGMSSNEHWQKFLMQYAIVPLFGMYTDILWYKAAAGGIALFVMAAGVHVAYWTQSYHSRQYRLEQWRAAYATRLIWLNETISSLNGSGYPHVADGAVVGPMLKGESPDFELVALILQRQKTLLSELDAEFAEFAFG